MSILAILETLFIGPLKLVFEIIFEIAHRVIGHPGLAIVVLSLVMNVLVLPLYRRADAMQEEARDIDEKLRDGVAHIKKTFSGDERMMILQTYYRQNNYKPSQALNGSVSLLLEIPFFMAAYQFLSHLESLNGVSFGPIQNMGAPDGMLVVGGIAINVLPILMTLINVVSSAIYLKGFPLKTKIQLYAMAAFFMVFLYKSPAGLVFYWTLNNVFSLAKNIFYKIKNPRKVLNILLSASGVFVIFFALFIYSRESLIRNIFLVVLGIVMQLPAITSILAKNKKAAVKAVPNKKLFIMASIALTVLTGVLIPSAFIASSPQEFIDISYFVNPMWYIVYSLCMAAGTFIIWMSVFYWIANDAGKVIFEKIMWILTGVMLVNYLFFGTDLGVISSSLVYEKELMFTAKEQLVNIAVIAVVAAVMYLFISKLKQSVGIVLLTAIIAVSGMSSLNVRTINNSVNDLESYIDAADAQPYFRLSKNGNNVVVIMLDRAMGEYMPYILNEKPELKEIYDGFTYYSNVISFGAHTNIAIPALLGGYEYTPVEMNKRDQETIPEKHDEALKVIPLLLTENGYEVTICDPPYAGYEEKSDLTIYDEYENINAFISNGKFTEIGNYELKIEKNNRNFFCLSIMKTLPLFVQPVIYDDGVYNNTDKREAVEYSDQEIKGLYRAEGIEEDFMESYEVLCNLDTMTEITNEEVNTYMFMTNNTTHEPMLLQAPDYLPMAYIDNEEYEHAHEDRFTLNGITLNMSDKLQVKHYHANMAAIMAIGEWLEFLKENSLYDNTRIIIVSDHGYNLGQLDNFLFEGEDMEYYYPLLMVKDFNATGFNVSDEFMTNADVPYMTVKDVIENPVNPFTGKEINNDEKYAHDQFVSLSHDFKIEINNGKTFSGSRWAAVKDDMWNPDNWNVMQKEIVLKEHTYP